jgi:N-acetylmuramoyl-L-alanine amidase
VRISDHLLEKDLTLALSVRLRSTLAAHGIAVVTTRENDSDPLAQTRAADANRTHASACLLLHATASGSGVHLYTSSLPQASLPAPGTPRPWATAQAGYITQSLKLSSDVSEALGHAGIPVTLGSVSLRQIDSMACPAVLLELAPLLPSRGKVAASLDDGSYQTRLIDALGGALEQWRSDWKAQP